MAKKVIKGEDGKEYEVKTKKPFYKRIWFWILIVIVLFIGFGTMGGSGSSKSSESASGKATAHKTTNSEKGESSAKKSDASSITVDYNKYAVGSTKSFTTNYTDSSWNDATVTVNKVTIYKLTKPHKYNSANDGKFNAEGFVRLYFTVTAKSDISLYATQGTAIYSNGEQHEADSLENWDGDINNGATKTGAVTLPVESLANTSSLTTIRYKFTANPQSDMSVEKDYDFTLNLK
ncbi:hypothetical protein [Liquorilactobacillus mali]|uniref:Prophage related protein n=1 Tax=Liquorilactobacillus mali KCTC 3596 = DSM 20444 TaxID=1046596 RepID=J1F5W5_9LACO|nr:hypothetical protein [Liquorilactobacillus mali]EJF02127.1 prophage related protein [Liquorilactobacillus mali KCTC 3596 = DSM 20444]KRN10272.1 prophage related protein [Liquorilactobacillus mali KCTC 3596 = DSM 20444]QFQ74540.1 hypothetical protein LM596_05160 [Liquorilactobacillus mali]